MPFAVWLSKLATTPFVANLLVPTLARVLKEYFERQANRALRERVIILEKTAAKIENQNEREEVLREASRKLSDLTARR